MKFDLIKLRHIFLPKLGKSATKQYLIRRSMNILFNQITITNLPRKTRILNNIHAKAITVKTKTAKRGEILQLLWMKRKIASFYASTCYSEQRVDILQGRKKTSSSPLSWKQAKRWRQFRRLGEYQQNVKCRHEKLTSRKKKKSSA